MKNRKTTRRALVMSMLSLLLCVSMLVGTTFAWFTDSVTSGNNKIIAGNLDIELKYSKDYKTWNTVEGATDLFSTNLWEPGHTEVIYLQLSNKGTLALKYVFSMNFTETEGTNVAGETFMLSQYLKYDIVEVDAAFANRDAAREAVEGSAKTLATYKVEGEMDAKTTGDVLALVIYMPEEVGNEANYKTGTAAPTINLGLNLVATQLAAESDSFGTDYDTDATYPVSVNASVPAGATNPTVMTAGEVVVSVPAGAAAGEYTLEVANKQIATDAAGKTTVTFDINLYKDGVKVAADGTKYPVEIEVGVNKDVSTVTHNGEAVSPFHYEPTTGIVSFETDSFSPFAVTYTEANEDSVFVPEDSEAAEKLEEENVVAVDEKGNTYTTLKAAVESGASKLYFKEGADLGNVTHLDVDHSVTIYGNGAKMTGDFAFDFQKSLTKDTAITIYNLHGAVIWGSHNTDTVLDVNLYNCNDIRVYLNGTGKETNIGLYNCVTDKATLDGDTGVYSNANGKIVIDGCTFNNVECPVNLNHKIAGEQTVVVTDCTFVDCATVGAAAYYAPIRLYNSAEGANQTVTVSGNTFTYSEGKAPVNGADVLLNAKHNGVDATGTIKAEVQADAAITKGANVTLTHTVANKAELYAVAAFVNKHSNYEYPYAGEMVLLLNDIDLGGEEWTPIGDYRFSANRFCGIFDGNEKTISNFKISKKTDKNDSNKSSYGFFGNMEGTVKNLTIDNAQVCSYAYVGALVGRLTNGTLINCHVKNSAVETTYWQAGGMVGQLNDGCTVKGCTVTNTTVTGASALGGMFGPSTLAEPEEGVNGVALLVENCKVIDCALVQKGSFGGSYDNYFGTYFGYLEVGNKNRADINGCVVTNTTIKGVKSDLLSGDMDGEEIYVDGGKYLSDGISKGDSNTYYISNANGLATLNAMMADKTAGRDAVVNLTANIDFAGKTWTPVDSHADSAFEIAQINGNGHTIYNLTINGQAMFTRFAGTGDVVIEDITFDNATVNSTALNTSILTVQTYQNVLLNNVDVKNSSITGSYKVAPLIATVYNESSTAITATVKNCDVSDTKVVGNLDFMVAGMVAFVYESDNDKIVFENCTLTNVELSAKSSGYGAIAYVYTNDGSPEGCYNEVAGVTITNCTK